MGTVLGFDPATATGWALLKWSDATPPTVIEKGTISLRLTKSERDRSDSYRLQLKRLAKNVVSLRDLLRPDAIALERPFIGVNVGTGLMLAGIRGVLLACTKEPYFEYPPREVKAAFTLSGNAKKKDMIAAVRQRFGIDGMTEDEADAVAVAYTYWFNEVAKRDDALAQTPLFGATR